MIWHLTYLVPLATLTGILAVGKRWRSPKNF